MTANRRRSRAALTSTTADGPGCGSRFSSEGSVVTPRPVNPGSGNTDNTDNTNPALRSAPQPRAHARAAKQRRRGAAQVTRRFATRASNQSGRDLETTRPPSRESEREFQERRVARGKAQGGGHVVYGKLKPDGLVPFFRVKTRTRRTNIENKTAVTL